MDDQKVAESHDGKQKVLLLALELNHCIHVNPEISEFLVYLTIIYRFVIFIGGKSRPLASFTQSSTFELANYRPGTQI